MAHEDTEGGQGDGEWAADEGRGSPKRARERTVHCETGDHLPAAAAARAHTRPRSEVLEEGRLVDTTTWSRPLLPPFRRPPLARSLLLLLLLSLKIQSSPSLVRRSSFARWFVVALRRWFFAASNNASFRVVHCSLVSPRHLSCCVHLSASISRDLHLRPYLPGADYLLKTLLREVLKGQF